MKDGTISGTASLTEDLATIPLTTPELIYHKLKLLNHSEATGPDGIPNFKILKEFAEILSNPISMILNTSYLEQNLPSVWKQANITSILNNKSSVI